MQIARNTVARSRNVYTSSAFLLWRFNVAGNDQTYLDLQVKCPIFLPDFNQIWTSTDFRESPQYQISRKSLQWEPGWYMRMEGRTEDMTKVVAAFRNDEKAPKNGISPLWLLKNPNLLKPNELLQNLGI